MPYPYNENKMNKANYDAASAAIGGDVATTKLFWDKFDQKDCKEELFIANKKRLTYKSSASFFTQSSDLQAQAWLLWP